MNRSGSPAGFISHWNLRLISVNLLSQIKLIILEIAKVWMFSMSYESEISYENIYHFISTSYNNIDTVSGSGRGR